MSKDYNGGKAGYWINTSVALIPALLQLLGGLVAIWATRKARVKSSSSTTTQTVETVPTQDITD